MKFYCIDGTFSHCKGSCDKVRPFAPWVFNEIPDRGDTDPVLYIDHKIMEAENIPARNDFGWLCESPSILNGTVNWILDNLDWCEERFNAIYTPDISLLGISDLFMAAPAGSNLPWIEEWKMRPKSRLVSMIASNKRDLPGHRLRHEIIDGDPSIHAYGRGYEPIARKEEGLEDYMFSYCIENDVVDDYYTEKITDAVACGTVPIYWGSEVVKNLFNPDGIIFLDDLRDGKVVLSPELYQEMLPYAEENLNRLYEFRAADDIVQELMAKWER